MEISKTSDTTQADAGDVITYTVTVTNTGQAAYTQAAPASFVDDMSGALDDASYNDDANATAGSASFAAPALSWLGPLPVGATVTVTYSLTVDNPPTGNGEILNVVTTDAPGGNCQDMDAANCQTRATVVSQPPPPAPDLASTGSPVSLQLLVLGISLAGLGTMLTLRARWVNRRKQGTGGR
jgi:uncharacterized repeat protein (TIGR01451 family)